MSLASETAGIARLLQLATSSPTAQQKLYDLIRAGSKPAVQAFLAAEKNIDLDADRGMALRIAAQLKHFHILRELTLAGGDLYYATQCCYADYEEKRSQCESMPQKTKQDRENYDRITAEKQADYDVYRQLDGFYSQMAEKGARIETLRQQFRQNDIMADVMKELVEMKKELLELQKNQAQRLVIDRKIPQPQGQKA